MPDKKSAVCCWWIGVVFIAAALKYYYSTATALDLQWLLSPLALLTRLLSGIQFEASSTGEWLSTQDNIAIVKTCAGVNFTVLSFLVFARRLQPAGTIKSGKAGLLLSAVCCIVLSMLCAWTVTLVVNTARILVSIQLYRQAATFAGLSPEQLHRVVGILIYFPALWLQFRMVNGIRTGRAGRIAAILYLGLVTGIPLLDGNYRTNPGMFAEHTLFTVGMTLGILMLYPVCLQIGSRLAGICKSIPFTGTK